ncbi:MAG: phage tail tape measure protein [Tepidanaerobacter acetatoxydans]|uniref:phage tail tape measure protein n=1 Tax=Tepidanaerobacter acetatoxydans TaxID=499229 RepID=UPI0026EEA4F0|nr:phage tail tape measure protein [Tepidanaerobacter acetatoxydans]NLU09445.1 phage tail tape measure protein [Tepidanaerobacter acetatoxydans]
MAGKYLELAFKLSGETDKSVRSAFKNLKVDIEGLNKKIASLEKTRGEVKRFEGLRKDVIKTMQEFNKAKKKTEELAKEFNNATKRTNELRDEYNKAKDVVNKLAKEIKNITNPTEELKNKFKEAEETLNKLDKEVKEAERSTKNLKKQYEDAQNKTSSLSSKLEKQTGEYKKLKSNIDEAGISTRNFTQDQIELEKKLRNTIKAQKEYNESKSKLETAKSKTAEARAKLVDAAAMGATIAVPVKLAIDAENTMADIRKVVDFDSEIEFKNMEKTIMDISKNIPMSFNQIGEIIAAGGQSGIDKIDLPDFAVDAAKMGIAFDITAEEAGQMMAEWRAAFRMNQEEVVVLADKINYLGNTTAANAPKISEVVTRIGPLGDVGGVASGEIAALGATLVGMGISEEIAATGIKNLILTMNKGSAVTKRQAEVYKELGIDAEELAKKMQKDAKGAIIDLLEALKQVPEHARAAKLEQLIGKESIAAIAPLLTNIQELEKNFAAVDEAQRKFAGSMEAEYQARAATTENSLQLLRNQMQNMGITVGSVLLPPLVQLTSILSAGATKIQELAEKYPNLVKWIVMGTTAFLALNVALIAGVYVGRLIKETYLTVGHAFKTLKLLWVEGKIQAIGQTIATKALSAAQMVQTGVTKLAAGAQWALNAAMNANPIALIIGLIAGLVAIMVVLYKKSETARNIMTNMWNGIKSGAAKAGEAIKNTFGKAIEWVSSKVEWLGGLWDKTIGKLFKGKKGKGGSGGDMPAYASGGIVTGPQLALVGEGGVSEAIIPLEKTANSISLWEKAGRALGINMSPRGIDIASGSIDKNGTIINNSSSGDKYEFIFNIDAKGAAPGIEDIIKNKMIKEVLPVIMRAIDEKEKDRLRVSIT